MPTTPPKPSEAIAALAAEYWEARMNADPIEATLLGDRRFDARMPDLSPDANQREIERLRDLRARVATVDLRSLSDPERMSHGGLVAEIETDLAQRECRLFEWTIDQREGPQVLFQNLAQLQTFDTPEQGAALLARWQKLGADLDQRIANLRRALADGRVATSSSIERVIRQLDDLLEKPLTDWVLAAPARRDLATWPDSLAENFRAGVNSTVAQQIRPAFQRYRDVLKTEILPRARDDQHVGVLHVPDGLACYARMIKVHTSLALAADDIHHIGLQEVAKIRAEMMSLGSKLFGTTDLASIQRRLRSDGTLFFKTRKQVEDKAKEALARANAAMPRWFSRLPKIACVVKRIESYEEKDTTIAYYRQPSVDGSRGGTYYINTYAPETRPRYEAEVLAFHESVPGHHTQIALGQEMTGIPEFRRHAGVTAFVEGWALYTERLADEMGLYTGDLDRMGMLSFDAWRASRLVVDTGIHVKGWSRDRAITFMHENTALAENNIANEVDRYISWPGQALAYKIGQREIMSLRRGAQDRLGGSFDIKAFHDVILRNGAVSLEALRGEVERWIGSIAQGKPGSRT